MESYPFKYISCYYLSNMRLKCTHSIRNSNTSHVIIYPLYHRKSLCFHCIQIHLMLLFISIISLVVFWIVFIQIHLMLLFIVSASDITFMSGHIQIHLMLLFIQHISALYLT